MVSIFNNVHFHYICLPAVQVWGFLSIIIEKYQDPLEHWHPAADQASRALKSFISWLHPGHIHLIYECEMETKMDGWMERQIAPRPSQVREKKDQEMCHLHRYKERVPVICLSHRVSCVHSPEWTQWWNIFHDHWDEPCVLLLLSPPGREMPAIPQVRRGFTHVLGFWSAQMHTSSALSHEDRVEPLGSEAEVEAEGLGAVPGLPWRRRWGWLQ